MSLPLKYAIIDIETTGGDPRDNRITEIAVFLHDGEKVLDKFVSLVNPEMAIPDFIVNMTGIDNEMVRHAPRFYEIAKQVVEITRDAVFVAHNVRFDYSFVQKEFRRLGYTFVRRQLCTVKLSRRLMPGMGSYGLRNLCEQLGIRNAARHRAEGDAAATVTLFERLLRIDNGGDLGGMLADEMSQIRLPASLDPAKIDELPEETGVYYFHNRQGKVIYVGKSTDIRKRVLSHFQGAHKAGRTMQMLDQIHDLSWELTGSELIALLLENEEIKRLQPGFNVAQRRKEHSYGLYREENELGYQRIYLDTYDEARNPIAGFSSRNHAEASMTRNGTRYQLCPKLYGAEKGPGRCFHYQLHLCKGACIGEEPAEDYNGRVEEMVNAFSYGRSGMFDFVIIGQGRHDEEKSVVSVRGGLYQGFGYLDRDLTAVPLRELADYVPRRPDSPDVHRIIRQYIKKHPRELRVMM
ncbi:MAG: DNA polymerase III subunit epsilon [Bacteroidetes bacterium]|nr:MAG: DNA polymerase III subunit epsilon [Bacteroidota bacterium]